MITTRELCNVLADALGIGRILVKAHARALCEAGLFPDGDADDAVYTLISDNAVAKIYHPDDGELVKQQEAGAAREESRFRMEQEADRLGLSDEAVARMEDEGLAEAIGRAQLQQAPSEDTHRVSDYVEDDVDRITREALADEEMTDADREDYANEDIPFPFPETGAQPAPAEDVGPPVEPAAWPAAPLRKSFSGPISWRVLIACATSKSEKRRDAPEKRNRTGAVPMDGRSSHARHALRRHVSARPRERYAGRRCRATGAAAPCDGR